MFPENEPDNLITISSYPYRFHVIENTWITPRDGTRLAARLWLPVMDRPVPVVLEYIPYHIRDGRRVDDELIHPFFAGHGFAGVRVDIRGSGNSDGLLTDEYLKLEQDDALEIIAWIASQPWCNGSVGMMGLSWGGFNSLQVAARRPPALKAIIAVGATVDRYNDDVHYKQGCLLNENFGWGSSFMSFNSRPPDPAVVGERWRDMWLERLDQLPFLPARWLSHQHRDAYWRHGSVCEDYGAIQCPVMIVTGWGDAYVNAVPRLLENLQVPTQAIAGPWAHQYPHLATPGPAIDFLGEAVAWWQQWLESSQALPPQPRYRAFQSRGASVDNWAATIPGQWLATNWEETPPTRQQLFLTDRGLRPELAPLSPHQLKSPVDCGVTAGEFIPHCKGPEMPLDQRLDDGKSLLFDSAPLTEPLDLWGDASLTVTVRSDRPAANLIARLCDVGPDGRSCRVTLGVLNLTQHHSQTLPELFPTDLSTSITIQFDHVCHRFLPGHRIRLALSTSYWPMIWPQLPEVTLTISDQGTLSLPFPTDAEPVEMGPPKAPAAQTIAVIEPADNQRDINFDAASGKTTVNILDYYGKSRFLDHELVTSGRKEETFAIRWGVAESATHTLRWIQTMARDDWSVKTILAASMRASPESFHLLITLTATENEVEQFQRTWRRQIPRAIP